MLVGYSFTENITVDAAVGILETSKPIYTTVSLGKFIDQLLLKVISYAGNKERPSDSKRINSCLTHCSEKKE